MNTELTQTSSPEIIESPHLACIDKISNGFVSGWAYNKHKHNEVLELKIVANGEVLGEGLANLFRKDLETAGIGNGYHAFEIEIFQVAAAEKLEPIQLYNAKTGELIETIETSIKILEQEQNLILEKEFKIQQQVIHFSLLFKSTSRSKKPLLFYIGDEKIHELPIQPEKKVNSSLLIPINYLDGNVHVLTVKLGSVCVFKHAFISPFHSTPEKYLHSSNQNTLFTSLSNLAKFRYESLVENLNRSAIEDSKSLKQLSIAHEKVVLGYEKNQDFAPLHFPLVKHPEVSIIIPVYNNFNLTYHCLCSILLAPTKVSYEVIIADDCSDDETTNLEKIISNVTVIRNKENLRFLKSCNRASEKANGKYLVFLNNDTEVTKYWLDELLNVFNTYPDAGLVGSKLLNADGTLQEAGGVVWKTGVPWNVGYGQNPFAPEFNYIRQADYVSGASMMIEKSLWEELGKFSLEFAPAYFEDTDLAFKVKNSGKKVYYTPFSQVIHFEGKSNGTDINAGVKKYQKVNQKTFKKKWAKLFKTHGSEGKDLLFEIDRGKEKRVLVIDYQTPQLHNDAGSYAAIQEIKLMIGLGFKVTFLPENLAFFAKHTHFLQRLGVEVLHAPFSLSVNEVIEKRGS